MGIPFEQIRDTHDRSWSSRLVDIIEQDGEDNPLTDDAVDVLGDLGDPAVTARLLAIATDSTRRDEPRKRAIEVLDDAHLLVEGNRMREWWASGDEVLRGAALDQTRLPEVDLLEPLLADPLHPLYHRAINALYEDLDEKQWADHITSAISHFDPEIRTSAASMARWLEPVRATQPLIQLAEGPDEDAALTAIFSLSFFESREVLSALGRIAEEFDGERGEDARDALIKMATDFEAQLHAHLSGPAREVMDGWMQPVLGLVAINSSPRDYDYDRTPEPPSPRLPSSGSIIANALLDLEGSWGEKMSWLDDADWSAVVPADRLLITEVLQHHVDVHVRISATRIYAQWDDVQSLMKALDDTNYHVRAWSVIRLATVTKTPSVAPRLWRLLDERQCAHERAVEALTSWLHHFEGDPSDRLIKIALEDSRQKLRDFAIDQVADSQVHRLVDLLDQPPAINWELHTSVLQQLGYQKIVPPQLEQLRLVDNLWVAAACAAILDPPEAE